MNIHDIRIAFFLGNIWRRDIILHNGILWNISNAVNIILEKSSI